MTLDELRDLLELKLGTPLPDVVRNSTPATQDTNLTNYINLAQQELASRLGGVQSSGTLSLVDGTRTYARPTGLLGIDDVRYVAAASDERPLEEVHTRRALPVDYRSVEGVPTHFYTEGNSIGLYPIPGADQDAGTVRIYGWFKPSDLANDDDEPDWPEELHRAIAILAGAIILEAQARTEAMASEPDYNADSVATTDRTREYAFRARDLRAEYEAEVRNAHGPVFS